MAFRKYIIRNGKEKAWLTNIYQSGKDTTYTYMPDIGMAMTFPTLHEARKIAKSCRGQVQALRMDKTGQPYGEDLQNEKKSV